MSHDHAALRRPVVLVILDGFGVNPSKIHNGVAEARTPRLDEYFHRYPWTLLDASGKAAGLPEGQMGNSEVGHMTLGSGTLLRQDLVLIDEAIANGDFCSNPELNAALDHAESRGRPMHFMGLASDGGVHSHLRHLLAGIGLCEQRGIEPLVHLITDGRDTAPQSALGYVAELEDVLVRAGGSIVSVMGRYFALDRDKRWDRVERAWRAMVLGKGKTAVSATAAIEMAYARKETDEFIQPTAIAGYAGIWPADSLFSFNFRKDRVKQIVAALALPNFAGFDRGDSPLAAVTCMMKYDNELRLPYAFVSERPATTLSRVVSEAGLSQFHCAETEKYAHVTYFFNGGSAAPASGEKHLLIPSPGVATYDLQPEMSAKQVADAMVNAIRAGRHAFMLVNFANGDMVGHSGKRHAVLQAVETLDMQVGRVLDAAEMHGYSVLLTADHGNCELLVDPVSGAPHTQHTLYPVPCMVMDKQRWQLKSHGALANVAPTVLQLMGLPVPDSMDQGGLLLQPQAASVDDERALHAA